MKLLRLLKTFTALGIIAPTLSCEPEVETPSIENCLVSKIDGFEIFLVANGSTLAPKVTATSTVFTYDNNKRPVRFSYFLDSQPNGSTRVTYNNDGTLKGGTNYDKDNEVSGSVEYKYNSEKKLIQQSLYDTEDRIIEFTNYEYNENNMRGFATTVQANYDNLLIKAFSYRYDYDGNKNVTKMHSRYLVRQFESSSTFFDNLLKDLKKVPEVTAYTLAGYDNKYNPYRSEPTLAILFDFFPAYNNATTITYNYTDTGKKYAELTYNYEFNRKGFPYIYTTKVDYTEEYTKATGLADYTNTSSFEYICK